MSNRTYDVTEHFLGLLTLSLNSRFAKERAIMKVPSQYVHPDYS